jgi:hypothetical protein
MAFHAGEGEKKVFKGGQALPLTLQAREEGFQGRASPPFDPPSQRRIFEGGQALPLTLQAREEFSRERKASRERRRLARQGLLTLCSFRER